MPNSIALTSEVLRRLHQTLLACGPFDSNRELRDLFVDPRLAPWRDAVPEANTRQARVRALVAALSDQANAGGQNALALFLAVLRDNAHPDNACHLELARLLQDLGIEIPSSDPTSPPARPATSAPGSVTIGGNVHGDVVTGHKETVFDMRGQQGSTNINVAGDYVDQRQTLTPGQEAQPLPSQGGGPATSAAVDLASLRQRLRRYDDVDLDALCLDHFPEVYDKFARGLRRDEKINLLLDHCRRHPPAATRLATLLH